MWSIVFDVFAMVFLAFITLVAFGLGLIIAAVKQEDSKAVIWRGVEAAVLAFLGGFIARLFITVLMVAAKDSPGAGLLVGWWFFLWPGALDTILWPFGVRIATTTGVLAWIATVVGAATGMMDGLWRVHDWRRGLGFASFLLDVTWGLAGSTNALLLHLVNFAWAEHGAEMRQGVHRYAKGFRVKSGFALTLGAVMSNMSDGPGTALFRHERTHAWQNRAFGPLFTLTYLGWMALWLIPALIASSVKKVAAREAVENYCYYNNPWETWAYRIGAGPRAGRGPLVWSDGIVLAWSVPFFVVVTLLTGLLTAYAW